LDRSQNGLEKKVTMKKFLSKHFDSLKSHRGILLITLLGLLLAISDLTDIFFWADEGWTLILSRFTLKNGYPMVFDEHYTLCNNIGVSQNGLWASQPWGMFYLTALSMAFFGKSLFFLRLPFVLIGISCIPLLALLGKRLRESDRIIHLSCLFLALNVPFLLLIKNVRYYALPPFFTLILIILYLDLGKGFRWFSFGLVSALYLHTFPPAFLGLWAGLAFFTLIWRRKKEFLIPLLYSQILAFLLFLPWILLVWDGFADIIHHGSVSGFSGQPSWGHFLANVIVASFHYVIHLVKYNFPALLLIPLLVFRFANKTFENPFSKNSKLLLIIVPFICLLMAGIRNYNLWSGYVLSCIPLLCLLSAKLLDCISLKQKKILIPLILIFLFSNLLNLPFWPQKKSLPPSFKKNQLQKRINSLKKQITITHPSFLLSNYLKELVTPYEGPVEGIVDFLAKNSGSKDTFFATNDGHTIHFMTGLKRIQNIPFKKPPTWIIRRGNSSWAKNICKNNGLNANQYIPKFLKENRYEWIVLDFPDLYHENEPVLPHHHFVTPSHKRKVSLLRYSP